MAVASYILPRFRAFDDYGRPMVGAKLYTYQNKTTTPAPTYQDAQQSAANTNPIVLDASGEAIIYLLIDQVYTFVLKDKDDVQVWSNDDVKGVASAGDLAGEEGSAGVGFKQVGSGSVYRTSLDKMRDVISVRDFIDTAIDGVTSNQLGIEKAVAAAFARGAILDWPVGLYVSNANIPNLHAVRHTGAGVIVRGAYQFRLTPLADSENVLYVSASALAGGDGLSPTAAILGLQGAIDSLENYGPVLDGRWALQLTGETFGRSRFPETGLRSRSPIEIRGVDVGGHPNVPQTVVSEGDNGITAEGIWVRRGTNVRCKNIRFVGFNGSTSSGGLTAGGFCEIYTENCHFENNTWGIVGGEFTVIDVKGGIFEGNGFFPDGGPYSLGGAIRGVFCAKFAVGVQNAGNRNNGPVIKNNNMGLFAQENCNGHLDWTELDGNRIHVRLNICSRLNMDGSLMNRAASTAIWGEDNSVASITSNTTFGSGVTANRILSIMNGGSVMTPTAMFNSGILPSTTSRCISRSISGQTINSTAPTIYKQLLLKPELWRDAAATNSGMKCIRYRIYATLVGTAGFKRLQARFGASPLALTFTSSETGSVVVDGAIMLNTNPVGSQFHSVESSRNGASPRVAFGTLSEALTSETQLNFEALVESTADSITINAYEVSIDGL